MREPIIYLKILINFILMILLLLVGIFVLPKVIRFFMPFVIGWIIAMIANPLVKFLEKKVKIVRKHSSAIIIIVVILGIVGALYGLIVLAVKEIMALSSDIPNIYSNIEAGVMVIWEKVSGFYDTMPDTVKQMLNNFVASLSDFSQNLMQKEEGFTFGTATNFAKTVMEGILGLIVTVVSAYFFIAQRDELVAKVKKIMPEGLVNNYRVIADNFKTAFGGYFKAQFKIMLIIIGILFLGFEILRVNYSFLLAIGIAFLDFLPFFGTGLVIWPWAVMDFVLGNYGRAIGLLVIYLICQVVKQVLQPKMVGDSIGISPLLTLLFMFIGYRFMKVLGMIIGIPIGMVIINFYRIGVFDPLIRDIKIIVSDINRFRKY